MGLITSAGLTIMQQNRERCGAQAENPACQLNIIETYEDYEYIQEGDIMIGGILAVNSEMIEYRKAGEGYKRKMCVVVLPQYYRQLVDFRLLIKIINHKRSLFPNLTLGYHIYDSCGDAQKAVRSVLQILSGTREPVPNYSCVGKRNIAGFIGDVYSATTVPIAQILSLFGYSQISSGATDPLLSDRVTYPYFFRTVQSDHHYYLAFSQLLKHFGWTWIGIIRLDDYEGGKEHQLLMKYLSSHGICVEFSVKISSFIDQTSSGWNEYNKDMQSKQVIQKSSARVILLCGMVSGTSVESLQKFTEEFIERTLILSYTIYVNYHMMDYAIDIFNGSLGLIQYLEYSLQGPILKPYLESIRPSNYPEDKLLEDIWMRYHLCLSKDNSKNNVYKQVYKDELRNCTGKELITNVRHFDNPLHSPHVAFAAYILTHAIHIMQMSIDQEGPKKSKNMYNYKHQLHHYFKNIPFKTNTTLNFEENGEFLTHYRIYYYTMKSYSEIHMEILGWFLSRGLSDQQLYIGPYDVRWKTNNSQIPKSQCSDNCLPGFRKAPDHGTHSCCYHCVPCSEGEMSNLTDSENCIRCPDMEWPNEKRNQCIAKTEQFLSYTNDVISDAFISVSILFSLITVIVLGIFVLYRDSPIVRANNRSLSFLLLVSIKLSFLSVFLFLGRPVDITCMLRIITFGITFSIAVSSLLAKTIMVCVAFKATKPGSSWRKWLGVKLSNSVVLFCSSIQIIICMTWLAISPPFQELDIHTSPGTIIIQCNEGSAIGFYSVIGYMGLLAAVSFVLAFLARSLPDSFNEAKYITFSMLLFCSVWITMIPAYLSTKGKNTVCVEIFAILTSSAGLLASIFLPKCYMILFRPEMNTKSNLLGNKFL
ncbi:vomeronasal type-2 receptor 26-like [Xenopus tropicalis]|uniref:Vomeronasal type-2 receptor 26-like n=1 Tax=Xenopus tropicalis TaxID=8364 RepID=A0A8J1J1Z8_XENTR|nr:vomeronasal type-2 receptor 26-like [Xenopus tropicalis]